MCLSRTACSGGWHGFRGTPEPVGAVLVVSAISVLISVMVRNFSTVNSLPPSPMRVWRNRALPDDVNLMEIAVSAMIGDSTMSANRLAATSNERFRKRSIPLRSGRATSTSGNPPRSASRARNETNSKYRGTKAMCTLF